MSMRHYYSRKELKICVECGEPTDGGVYCEVCRLKRTDQKHQRNQAKRYMDNHSNESLDELAKEAHDRHISYGQLQRLKMLEGRD